MAVATLADYLAHRSVALRFASFLFLILAATFAMTANLCHPRFFLSFNEAGQCSASDYPSEVFGSFLLIFVVIALVAVVLAALIRRGRS
ncbi:hypothetical protein [Paracoccus saliphilus]|nr:hypothetical protein [Paracoccus saliphilus]WCR04153.1 hypothetical protein JHX88_05250 [Paracoccus saliphilus]